MADASIDQHHRRVEQSSHVGGRRRRAVDGAVEEAHHAFDDEQVRAARGACAPAARRASGPHSHGSRLRPGRPHARAWYPGSMKSGPTLAAGDPCAAPCERGQQTGGHRGLADARRHAGDRRSELRAQHQCTWSGVVTPMLGSEVGVTDAARLADAVLTPGPRRAVRARVAVRPVHAVDGLDAGVARSPPRDPGRGRSSRRRRHRRPYADSKSSTWSSSPLDELARGEEPEEQCDPPMTEPRHAVERVGHRRPRHAGEARLRRRVHPTTRPAGGRRGTPRRSHPGRTSHARRTAAGARPHRPLRRCGARSPAARARHRGASRTATRPPDGAPRPSSTMAGTSFLPWPAASSISGCTVMRVAAAVHQVVEHRSGRRVGQLEEAQVDVQVRSTRHATAAPRACASSTPAGSLEPWATSSSPRCIGIGQHESPS